MQAYELCFALLKKPVHENLLKLVKDKDYFVITTNVDHSFQKAGFDKKRLFYTQGDYGLLQCSEPCHMQTYDTGVEVLIHVGLETVSLHGKPFKVRVKKGDKVKRGQLLLEADLKTIKSAGLNTITPVIVCNFGDYSAFNTIVDKNVTTDDLVIEVEK